MADIKILWLDLETTGLDPMRHGIIQMSGMVEINGKIKKTFDFKCNPGDCDIDDRALAINKISRKVIVNFEDVKLTKRRLIRIFDKYIDRYDKTDKFILAGYNVIFDLNFIVALWEKLGDSYLFSYIKRGELDPLHLLPFIECNNILPSLSMLTDRKLENVAGLFNITVANSHNAAYDIALTRAVYKRIKYKISEYYMNKVIDCV